MGPKKSDVIPGALEESVSLNPPRRPMLAYTLKAAKSVSYMDVKSFGFLSVQVS